MRKWKKHKKYIASAVASLLIGQVLIVGGASGTASAATVKVKATPVPTASAAPTAAPSAPSKAGAAVAAVDLKLDAKAAILIDAASGDVLYEMNADTALPPASMAKMMTEYLTLESIQKGTLKWDDIVTTSQYAATIGGSGGLLAKGEQLTVKDMFYAMSIDSANDATVALAEKIGDTEENFAHMMNDKAKALGLSKDAYFIDATGLDRSDLKTFAPASLPGETIFTARDAALLAQSILRDHKEILDFTKIPSKKLRDRDKTAMINWDWMLEGNKDITNFKKYAYTGLDGLKTGHTDNAGYCFTGTAVRNGMRIISVVMGTAMESKRFEESRKLLDYGFNNFETKQVIAEKTTIDSLKFVQIEKGITSEVPLVTQTGLTLVVKKGTDDQIIKTTTAMNDKLVAPIKTGDQLGTLTVAYNNKSHSIKLIATEEVKKASWIRLLFRSIGHFFASVWKSIKNLF
ncbi:MAG: peptidase [Bacilli bacterium]|nr:peptidase [Bacilli bacterium]